ncbi:MAG TPA: pyrimidine/purine nucleoside phosphorylase [Acidiferrobacterales bacterium]|nr:pyrimidine/purine nucleoside phosphorylase [Acidiferrobacterales bacterium]
MSFYNVEVKKKANIYHGGKVTSRTIITERGEKKTLGVMLPGAYRFETGAAETIDILLGSCRVKPAGKQVWEAYRANESFSVPANSYFEIEVNDLLDYVCHFDRG